MFLYQFFRTNVKIRRLQVSSITIVVAFNFVAISFFEFNFRAINFPAINFHKTFDHSFSAGILITSIDYTFWMNLVLVVLGI